MKHLAPWLAGLAAVGVVAAAGWAGWTYLPPPAVPDPHAATAADDPFAPPPQTPVRPGRDYVVLVRAARVGPKGQGGKTWERGFSDGPDLYYDLTWQGNVIFTSPVVNDTLIGRWEAVNVDVWEAAQNGGTLDLGRVLNNGAVVRTPGAPDLNTGAGNTPADVTGGVLRVRVYDSDTLSGDDLAGEVNLNLPDLVEGDTELTFPGDGPGPAGVLLGLDVRVTDADQPVRGLLEMLRAP